MSAEDVIEYTDADTGQPFTRETLVKEMRPGEITTKTINIKNIHPIYPIRLINPKTSGLRILTYPTALDDKNDIIRPGATRNMEIEVDVPKEAITPPITTWEFDVAVIAVG
jgi:hypothetical protein